ncbi:MAG: hypothetical protein Q9227_008437 [Pyrenula ochraceoflavens]
MSSRNFWPQPALEKLNINIVWDGNPSNPASLSLTIELRSLNDSRLSLIDPSHPLVQSVKIAAIKFLDLPQLRGRDVTPVPSLLENHCQDIVDDEYDYDSCHRRPRELFTPPARSPRRSHKKLELGSANGKKAEPKLYSKEGTHARHYPQENDTSETPLEFDIVRLPRREPTATTAEISLSSFDSSEDLKAPPYMTSKSHVIPGIDVSKRSKTSLGDGSANTRSNGSKVPPQTRSKSPPKRGWNPPGAGDTIFPHNKAVAATVPKNAISTFPRRVSRSLGPKPQSAEQTCGKAEARNRRSTSTESLRDRKLHRNAFEQTHVAEWIRDMGSASLTDESRPDGNGADSQSEYDEDNHVRLHKLGKNNAAVTETLHPPPPLDFIRHGKYHDSLRETAKQSDGVRPKLRGGVADMEISLYDNQLFVSDIGGCNWLEFGSCAPDDTLTVGIQAKVNLEKHPQGGHTLIIPGLPKQAGDAQGTYSVTIVDPSESVLKPEDNVRLFHGDSIDELENGLVNEFPLIETFSLRFLCHEQHVSLRPEDFNVAYDVQEVLRKDSKTVGTRRFDYLKYVVACQVTPCNFIWWADEVDFTLYLSNGPNITDNVEHVMGKRPQNRVVEFLSTQRPLKRTTCSPQSRSEMKIKLHTPTKAVSETFWITWNEISTNTTSGIVVQGALPKIKMTPAVRTTERSKFEFNFESVNQLLLPSLALLAQGVPEGANNEDQEGSADATESEDDSSRREEEVGVPPKASGFKLWCARFVIALLIVMVFSGLIVPWLGGPPLIASEVGLAVLSIPGQTIPWLGEKLAWDSVPSSNDVVDWEVLGEIFGGEKEKARQEGRDEENGAGRQAEDADSENDSQKEHNDPASGNLESPASDTSTRSDQDETEPPVETIVDTEGSQLTFRVAGTSAIAISDGTTSTIVNPITSTPTPSSGPLRHSDPTRFKSSSSKVIGDDGTRTINSRTKIVQGADGRRTRIVDEADGRRFTNIDGTDGYRTIMIEEDPTSAFSLVERAHHYYLLYKGAVLQSIAKTDFDADRAARKARKTEQGGEEKSGGVEARTTAEEEGTEEKKTKGVKERESEREARKWKPTSVRDRVDAFFGWRPRELPGARMRARGREEL